MRTAVYFAGFAFALALFVVPGSASAAEAFTVQTRQVLPPGGTSCPPMQVLDVTAYVYNGSLDSFDVTISDRSYVALIGTAGQTSIPFYNVTRRIDAAGNLRMHIDTDPNAGPVALTLLSAQGQVTCMAVLTFAPTGTSAQPIVPITPIAPGMPSTPAQGGSGTGGQGTGGTGSGSGGVPATSAPTTTPEAPEVVGGFKGSLGELCDAGGAYRLWFLLTAIYIIIVSFIGLAQPPLRDRHIALPAAAVLAPLAILLGFWLLSTACRGSVWIPVLLVLIGAAGLFAAYRASTGNTDVIVLPPAQK